MIISDDERPPQRGVPRNPDGTIPPSTALGAKLRELRVGANYSQADLARKMPTQAGRISDWERGFHLPTLPILLRYAKVFDTTVSELLRDIF